MRRTEKDRAIRKKQKQASMAVKLSCKHERRTPIFNLDGRVRFQCLDCPEVILMLSHTVSSTPKHG